MTPSGSRNNSDTDSAKAAVGTHETSTPAKHRRQESGFSAGGMSVYDFNGDGRICREDLSRIVAELKNEKQQRKTYKTVAVLVAALLVVVLGVNAVLTYVVVNLSKDITVEDNKIVAKGVNRQTPAGLRLPLESAEAMRTHVVAKDQVYKPPSGAALMSMKSLVYVDAAGIHKHNIASVTISKRTATVYSTVPGVIFEFTPKGMYMFEVPSEGGLGNSTLPPADQPTGRKLLRKSTMDCVTEDYEDDNWDEDLEEYVIEQLRVTECTSWGGMFTVITYSVLNELGDWEIEYQERWFQDEIAPWFFGQHDNVGTLAEVGAN